MKKIFFLCAFIVYSCVIVAQRLQLVYNGSNKQIIAAVAETNKLLAGTQFYMSVNSIQKLDNTSFTGRQIIAEINAIKTINVTEYYKKHTKATAKTQNEICINTAKLNRSLASIVNTLIHETIHAVDWLTNSKWDYTHKTQYEENPPISAPYVIGAIAEKMILPADTTIPNK